MIAKFRKLEIAYTESTYSVTLVEAVGLDDPHSEKYWNRWMRNLAHDIQKTLEAVGIVQLATAGS